MSSNADQLTKGPSHRSTNVRRRLREIEAQCAGAKGGRSVDAMGQGHEEREMMKHVGLAVVGARGSF
jgi:hypothetical protein